MSNADFRVTNHGTVWTIVALSDWAREYAEVMFRMPDWMGSPTHFTTDWRPARDIVNGLLSEGFEVEGLVAEEALL